MASFPASIKIFPTFQDQTGGVDPRLTTDFAGNTNEIHDEVVAIETTLGTNPFGGLPAGMGTLNQALNYLYLNKASGQHVHRHTDLFGDATTDDHPQYARVDGTRAFTGPVTAPNASVGTQLATLGQIQALGYQTSSSLANQLSTVESSLVKGAYATDSGMPFFPASTTNGWTLTGGYKAGVTDANGQLHATFGISYVAIQSITATPVVPGIFNLDCALITLAQSNAGFQFFNVTNGALYANTQVAFTWMLLGQPA